MPNEKIKVALMSYAMDNRPNKGTAIYARKLIENLLNDGRLEIYLVHFEKVNDPLYERAHEIIMPSLKLPRGNQFFSQLLFFWQYRKNRFDIIHWFQPRLYPFFWLAPAKKIVVTVHGAGEWNVAKIRLFSNWLFRNVLKYFNEFIDVAITDTEHANKETSECYKIKPEKVKTVYLGGGEVFEPIDKLAAQNLIESKYKIKVPYILDISRLMPHKNIDALIKAYNIYRQKFAGIEKLVIVGSPMLDYEKTYDLAKANPYKDDIQFINFVDQQDLNAIYSAAAVFVFPSLSEGFGLPVLEAMAAGTPVITSNTTSLPEVGGEAAILIDPLDIEKMAEAMRQVLSNENLRNEMIGKGLGQAKKFSWAKTAEQTKEIYIELNNKINR